ncbi:deoxycytidyl transferase [Polyrhizophydium stewartii]|uniref:DNA repair protein REV1 n=1 Tax=Polyrhizophydium stewartii TaxID=2732419 RepID=A0ABR4NAT2_9FUNG
MAYSGWHEYGELKRRKQDAQRAALARGAGGDSHRQIFAGVVLYVNGYLTMTTLEELKRAVLVRGAVVRDHLSSATTHIIAEQMTDSKVRSLRKPVVRPEWLLESINQDRLLDWTQFRLFTGAAPGQRSLLASLRSHGVGVGAGAGAGAGAGLGETADVDGMDPELGDDPSDAESAFGDDDEHAHLANTLGPERTIAAAPAGSAASGPQHPHKRWNPDIMPPGQKPRTLDLTDPFVRNNIATAPGFLKRYFAASRLHHLSIWKAELGLLASRHMRLHGKRPDHPPAAAPFRTIMHVDMDCFFASVALRSRPDLVNTPVVIAHSSGLAPAASAAGVDAQMAGSSGGRYAAKPTPSNAASATTADGQPAFKSTSEIASCNYAARACGIANGSFLGGALKLAPNLVVLPYDFASIDACSKALYRVLLEHADFVQAVSCDEAYIDVTLQVKRRVEAAVAQSGGALLVDDDGHADTDDEAEDDFGDDLLLPVRRRASKSRKRGGASRDGVGSGGKLSQTGQAMCAQIATEIAEDLRAKIRDATGGCIASIGIGCSMLLARIATKRAKPNGVFLLRPASAREHVEALGIRDLPGVGHVLASKCAEHGLKTCGDVARMPLPDVQRILGDKVGATLHQFAQGIDARSLENKERQSIGAEVTWGIRFQTQNQVAAFMDDFCQEIYGRAVRAGVRGKHITVKAKKRLYEGEPPKFLGHGHCADFSRSVRLAKCVDSKDKLLAEAMKLLNEIDIPPVDLRGVGLHLRQLEFVDGRGVPRAAPLAGGQRVLQFPTAPTSMPTLLAAAASSSLEAPAPSTPMKRVSHADRLLRTPTSSGGAGKRKRFGALGSPAALGSEPDVRGGAPGFFSPRKPRGADLEAAAHARARIKAMFGVDVDEIDPSVVPALPPDIRKELEEAGLIGTLAAAGAKRAADDSGDDGAASPSARREKRQRGALKRELDDMHLLPTASQIDPEVLRALPPDIRRELETQMQIQRSNRDREMRMQRQQQQQQAASAAAGASIDAADAQKQESGRKLRPQLPLFAGVCDHDAVLGLLSGWLDEDMPRECAPNQSALGEIRDYLVALVDAGHPDRAWSVLRMLSRRVGLGDGDGATSNSGGHRTSTTRADKGKGKPDWAGSFCELFDDVNACVERTTGAGFWPWWRK